MLPLPAKFEALYNAAGQHVGGIYPPIMVDGALTEAHAGCLSTRPAARLLYYPTACPEPAGSLGLVWMCPGTAENPLAVSPAVLRYLVYVLDAGASVQVHAASEAAIDATMRQLNPLVGGGHA